MKIKDFLDTKSINPFIEVAPEYYAIIWSFFCLGIIVNISKFVGARGTGKTVAITKTQSLHNQWGIIANPLTNMNAVMNKAKENKTKTQREHTAVLRTIERDFWKNLWSKQFEGKYTANNDRISHDRKYKGKYNGKNINTVQEKVYLSLEQAGEVGGRPNMNPDYSTPSLSSVHFEEIIGSGLRTKSDLQKHEENLEAINAYMKTQIRTLGKNGLLEYFSKHYSSFFIKKYEIQERFIQLWSFNNWTRRESTVQKTIEILQTVYDEDISVGNENITKKLDIGGEGYLFHYDRISKEVHFLTGIGLLYKWDKWRKSVGLLPVLEKQWYDQAKIDKEIDEEEYGLNYLGIPYEKGNMPLERLLHSYKTKEYEILDYEHAFIYVDQSGGKTKTGITTVFENDITDFVYKKGKEILPKSGTDFKRMSHDILKELDNMDKNYGLSGNYSNKPENWCISKDKTIDLYVDPSVPAMLFEIEGVAKSYGKKFLWLNFKKSQLKTEMDKIRKESDREKRIKKTAEAKEKTIPILENLIRYGYVKFDNDAKKVLEQWKNLKLDDDGRIIDFPDHLYDSSTYHVIRRVKRYKKLFDPQRLFSKRIEDDDFNVSLNHIKGK